MPGPNGLLMNIDDDPGATANTASATWPIELPARPQVEQSRRSHQGRPPRHRRAAAPPLLAGSASAYARSRAAGSPSRKTALVSRNAAAMARPPARGIGTVLIRRSSGRSTISWWTTNRRISGCEGERQECRRPRTTATMGRSRSSALEMKVTPRATLGPGTARRSRGPRRPGAPGPPGRRDGGSHR